jgi:Uma2 family endonuclease
MGIATQVSEREYLESSYEPDCEFADGVLVERNIGTRDHSRLQMMLGAYLHRRRKSWGIHVYPELRIRLRAGRYVIPDLCVVRGPEPAEQVFTNPAFLLVEILSPEDRPLRVSKRIREMLDFGVPYVWVIDPETFESELHTASGIHEITDRVLRIPGTPVEVPLDLLDED